MPQNMRKQKKCNCGGTMWDVSWKLADNGWNIPKDKPYWTCSKCLKTERIIIDENS